MYRILLVEDDEALRQQICEDLRKGGFFANEAVNYENIIEDFNKIKPQLVLVDVNLPCYDGFYWCSKIGEISKVQRKLY